MSTFYLKIAIVKKWWTQNFNFLSLKSSSPNQFWEPQLTRISLNFQSSWTTYESEVWNQNCVWLFYYFYFQRNYDVLRSKSPCFLSNKNTNFNKNETESKIENPTYSFRGVNLMLQVIQESPVKSKTDELELAKETRMYFL